MTKIKDERVGRKALKSFPTFWVIVLFNMFWWTFVMILFLIIMFIETSFKNMTIEAGIAVSLIPIVFMYLIWDGVLKECTKVKIYTDKIIIKRMFRQKQEFYIRELYNYRTDSMFGFKGSRHDYLYIIKNEMEITIISAFYHSNYKAMRYEIDINLEKLNNEKQDNPPQKRKRKIKDKDTKMKKTLCILFLFFAVVSSSFAQRVFDFGDINKFDISNRKIRYSRELSDASTMKEYGELLWGDEIVLHKDSIPDDFYCPFCVSADSLHTMSIKDWELLMKNRTLIISEDSLKVITLDMHEHSLMFYVEYQHRTPTYDSDIMQILPNGFEYN